MANDFKQRAIRQFRHNTDNSLSVSSPAEGFVFAYDQKETDREIARLEARERELREALNHLAHWARDIAGDTDLPAQREEEDRMMEWIDRVLAKHKEQSDDQQ